MAAPLTDLRDAQWQYVQAGWKMNKAEGTWTDPDGRGPYRFDAEGRTMIPDFDQMERAKPAKSTSLAPPDEEEGGGSVFLATPEESKVVVEDLATRYHVPPGFILAFKGGKGGRISPYFTKNFYGVVMERKGYSHLSVEKHGDRHDPAKHQYHYIAELIPYPPKNALAALSLLKDVADRAEFLTEYHRLTAPIHEEGYASPDTVKNPKMRTDYNLDRLARARAYRHMGALYCGVAGPMAPDEEEEADEVAEGAVDVKAIEVPKSR